jgi:hypothetical protein
MAVNLGFLDHNRYFFIQVAPQLSSRGWMDTVPGPLLLRQSGRAANRTRDHWTLDHRGVLLISCSITFLSTCRAVYLTNSFYKGRPDPQWHYRYRNSVASGPQKNYIDWATATCWRNLVPTFADRGESRGHCGGSPTVVNLSFLDRSR